jgi:hypothetical protein
VTLQVSSWSGPLTCTYIVLAVCAHVVSKADVLGSLQTCAVLLCKTCRQEVCMMSLVDTMLS